MAKKQDAYYFETFTACLDDACKAAQLLDRSMREFDPAQIKETLDEMHNIEHAADDKKHELLNVLAKAFITPIEREDIILLSQNIDEVTDKIEDVLEAKLMAEEFADFKRSKGLRDHIIRINTLEEEADQQFINSMRTLHTTCTDSIEIIVWREIFLYLEKCVDACEHVADTVESVVMKNS